MNYLIGLGFRPEIGIIICGSGLGTLADQVHKAMVFPYSDIPNFLQGTGNELCTNMPTRLQSDTCIYKHVSI